MSSDRSNQDSRHPHGLPQPVGFDMGLAAGQPQGLVKLPPLPAELAGEPLKRTLPPRQVIANRKLSAFVQRQARAVRKKFGPVDRATGNQLARIFLSVIVPRKKQGRPMTPEVKEAMRLRAQRPRPKWPSVFRQVISGYWTLPRLEREDLARKLQHAVRANEKRSQHRATA